MTPTHHTRDGRPVTIDKIGKRWMRGWIVNMNDRNIRWRDKWHKTGSHSFEADMDLTPVANAHLTAIIARSRDLFDDIPEPDPRDAEIDFAAAFVDMAKQVELLNRNENSMLGRISARDAEIERLRGEGLALANAWFDDNVSGADMERLVRAFLARNGGAK